MRKSLITAVLLVVIVAGVFAGKSYSKDRIPLQQECQALMRTLAGMSDAEKIETVIKNGAEQVARGGGDGGVRNLLILGAVLRGGGDDACKQLEFDPEDNLLVTQLPSITPALDSKRRKVVLAINVAEAVLEVRSLDSKTIRIPLLNNPKKTQVVLNVGRNCVSYGDNTWCDMPSLSESFHKIVDFTRELRKTVERFRHDSSHLYSFCKINPRGKAQERYFYYEPFLRRLYYSSKASTLAMPFDSSEKYLDLSGVTEDMISIDTEHVKACKRDSLCMRINDGTRVWPLCVHDPPQSRHAAASLSAMRSLFIMKHTIVEDKYLRSGAIELIRWALAQLMSVTATQTSNAGPLVEQHFDEFSSEKNGETVSVVVDSGFVNLKHGHATLITGVTRAIKTIKSGFTSEMEQHFGRSLKYLLGDIASGRTYDIYSLESDSELLCTLDNEHSSRLFDLRGLSTCPRADNRDAEVSVEQQWRYPVQFSLERGEKYHHVVMTKAYMFTPKNELHDDDLRDAEPDRDILFERAGLRRATDDFGSFDFATSEIEDNRPADEERDSDNGWSVDSPTHIGDNAVDEEEDGYESHSSDGNSAEWPDSRGEPKWQIVDSNAFTVGTSWRSVKDHTPFKFWLVNAYKTDIGGHVILRHGNIDRAKWTSDEKQPDDWPLMYRKYSQFKAWIEHLVDQDEIQPSPSGKYRVRSLSTVAHNMLVQGDLKMWKQQNEFFMNQNKFDGRFEVVHFNLAANMFSTMSTNDDMGYFERESKMYLRWIMEDTRLVAGEQRREEFSDYMRSSDKTLKGKARHIQSYLSSLAKLGNPEAVRLHAAVTIFLRLQDGKSDRLYDILGLALLDNALGVVSAINCRSGLDRTGWVFSAHVAVAQMVDVLGRESTTTWTVLQELFDPNGRSSFIRVARIIDSNNLVDQYEQNIARQCDLSPFAPQCVASRLRVAFFLNLMNVGYKVTNLSTGIPGFKWLQKGFGTILHHHSLFPSYVYYGEHVIAVKAEKENPTYGHLVTDSFMAYLLGGCSFRGA